jgi:hypothetical protein
MSTPMSSGLSPVAPLRTRLGRLIRDIRRKIAGAMILTSNRGFAERELFDDPVFATALLDRLL